LNLAGLAHPLLRLLPAEAAHRAAIVGLWLYPPAAAPPTDERLATRLAGIAFPNPLGLAAGFDKNAEVPGPALGLGFGFVEVGTLTPKPQPGNPKPRLFRLPQDAAVINRYGFNNAGYEGALARLQRRPRGLIGVNVGANKDSPDRVADYALGIRTFAKVADYFTVNVSSPNTPALRDLQGREALDGLLAAVLAARDEAAPARPVFLKIAPDLDERGLDDILEVASARRIDALIISNTTVARPPSLKSAGRAEMGGLSGRPLFDPSTRLLARAWSASRGALPLIGCGGIEDGKTALAKIEAGASLVQLYTSLALRGPEVVPAVLKGLAEAVQARRVPAIAALVGTRARDWL
jgi:dihydroorotate dehydrogenase